MSGIKTIAVLALLCTLTGCATITRWLDGWADVPAPQEFPEGLVWLHPDVSGWAVTANLSEVRLDSRFIHMPYDKARVWPPHDFGDMTLNANPWIIAQVDGVWYAATWEWLRDGQTTKAKSSVAGDHIKRREIPNDWRPQAGEKVGIMISGLVRGGERNVSERSNVVWINWE